MPPNISHLLSHPYKFGQALHATVMTFSLIIGLSNTYQLREMEKRASLREKNTVGMHMDLMMKGYGAGLYEGGSVKRVMCFEVSKGKGEGTGSGVKEEDVRGKEVWKEEAGRVGKRMESTWQERMRDLSGGVRGGKKGAKGGEGKMYGEVKGFGQGRGKEGSDDVKYIDAMRVIHSNKAPEDKKSVEIRGKGGVWNDSENAEKPGDSEKNIKVGKD